MSFICCCCAPRSGDHYLSLNDGEDHPPIVRAPQPPEDFMREIQIVLQPSRCDLCCRCVANRVFSDRDCNCGVTTCYSVVCSIPPALVAHYVFHSIAQNVVGIVITSCIGNCILSGGCITCVVCWNDCKAERAAERAAVIFERAAKKEREKTKLPPVILSIVQEYVGKKTIMYMDKPVLMPDTELMPNQEMMQIKRKIQFIPMFFR